MEHKNGSRTNLEKAEKNFRELSKKASESGRNKIGKIMEKLADDIAKARQTDQQEPIAPPQPPAP